MFIRPHTQGQGKIPILTITIITVAVGSAGWVEEAACLDEVVHTQEHHHRGEEAFQDGAEAAVPSSSEAEVPSASARTALVVVPGIAAAGPAHQA